MVHFAENFSSEAWWWRDAPPVERPEPPPAQADVVVVGGGYAGLSCAAEVAASGRSVAVLDRLRFGEGASGRNAGLCSGRAGISKMIDLEAYVGPDRAAAILDEADEAYDYFRRLADQVAPGAFEHCGRFVAAGSAPGFDKLAKKHREYQTASATGMVEGIDLIDRGDEGRFVDSPAFSGGMYVENAGLVHPARYVQGLRQRAEAAGAGLHSGVQVLDIDSADPKARSVTVLVHGERRVVRAGEIVLATNGYTDRSAPWHRARIVPMSSSIIATEPLGREMVESLLPAMTAVIDTNRVIVYARPTPDGEGILFGGRARFRPVGADTGARILYDQMMRVFPSLEGIPVTNAWSGFMAFTTDWLPKIGIHNGMHYVLGCNGGSGVVLMSWLGGKVGRRLAGESDRAGESGQAGEAGTSEEASSSLEGIPFDRQPLGSYTSAFVPLAGIWYRIRDAIDQRR